jgi:hypothetical protein
MAPNALLNEALGIAAMGSQINLGNCLMQHMRPIG